MGFAHAAIGYDSFFLGQRADGRLYDAGEFLQVQEYKNGQRWTDEIENWPAVKRGCMVNRPSGEPEKQLGERHDASDFELRTEGKLGSSNVA